MTADLLLSRLERVRQTGPGRWLARCPGHADRSPSLSVRELPDGRILVHDFGGCDPGTVLDAVGLTLADLFPDGPGPHHVPASRSAIPPADLLRILESECLIVGLAGAQFLEARMLAAEDWQRLSVAVGRIESGLAHVRGLR